MEAKKIFAILPLYFSPSDELFYRIIEITTFGKKNAVETLKTIPIDRINEEGEKISSKEYEIFRINHLEDTFIELGRVIISESYYQLITLHSKEN